MNANIIENQFRKVLVAAKRAKQIEKGARPRVQIPGMRATCVALEEIKRGLISFEFIPDQEKAGSDRR